MKSFPGVRNRWLFRIVATAAAALALPLAALAAPSSGAAARRPGQPPGRPRTRPPARGSTSRCRWAAGVDADGADDPGRQDQHGDRGRVQRAVRLLHLRDPEPVHPGDRRGRRPGRRGRRPDRRDADARRRFPGGLLRHLPGLPVRAGRRVGGAGQGGHGRPGADGEHRPRPALGTVVRGLHRGPVPELRAGGRRRRRGAEPGRDGADQAPRRLQPGDEPQHPGRRRDREHPGAERDLPPRVLGRDDAGPRGVGDVRLQHDQRPGRLPEPVPDADHPGPALGLSRLRDLGLPGHPFHGAVR